MYNTRHIIFYFFSVNFGSLYTSIMDAAISILYLMLIHLKEGKEYNQLYYLQLIHYALASTVSNWYLYQ